VEFTESDRQMLLETHGDVKTLLERVGEDGKGLCGRVESHSRRIRMIELIIAVAAGSGGIFAVGTKLIGS